MDKHRKIGAAWFSPEEYQNFVYLSKEEQVKYISDRLSPKDPAYAEVLLKKIPHGNGSGDSKKAEGNRPNRTTTSKPGSDNAQPTATES